MRFARTRAVVCGRRRKRYPERSVYNRLCDIEWDTPIGIADACGGDALIRVRTFQEVGGYREYLIAGEEPEMCLRMRRAGWTIERIDTEMTLHDAAMTNASQWWQRAKRCGYAWAEGFAYGPLISEKCGEEMSVGMTKFYRRTCFEEIGGFAREVMWDGIDCHTCRMMGSIACSWDDPQLRFVHLRPMGSSHKGVLTGRMRHGFVQHYMGTVWPT